MRWSTALCTARFYLGSPRRPCRTGREGRLETRTSTSVTNIRASSQEGFPLPNVHSGHGRVADSGQNSFWSSASRRIVVLRASISRCTCLISRCFRCKVVCRVSGSIECLADLTIEMSLRHALTSLPSRDSRRCSLGNTSHYDGVQKPRVRGGHWPTEGQQPRCFRCGSSGSMAISGGKGFAWEARLSGGEFHCRRYCQSSPAGHKDEDSPPQNEIPASFLGRHDLIAQWMGGAILVHEGRDSRLLTSICSSSTSALQQFSQPCPRGDKCERPDGCR